MFLSIKKTNVGTQKEKQETGEVCVLDILACFYWKPICPI